MRHFNVQEPPKLAPQASKKNKRVEVSRVDH
jgi:hypothetical protein